MLTGRETVPATFAATAHLHRAAPAALEARPEGGVVATVWGALVTEVRQVALALADGGAGPGTLIALDRTAPRPRRAVTVLVASVVGAEVVGGVGTGAGESLDLARLAVVGAGIDDRAPGRYEALVGRRTSADPLLRDGPVVHTSATLLVAARSLAQAAHITLDDRLDVDLAVGSVTEIVAGLLVPCLTGAATWVAGDDVAGGAVPAGQGPTFVASAVLTASTGSPPPEGTARRWPGARRRDRSAGVRRVVVGGDGGGPVPGTGATGLAVAAAGGIVTGFGRPGTLGRPLPGASVAIDDDGAVLVRAASTAPGAPGLRDDGWLPTGLSGTLDDGHLVVAEVAPPDPS